MTLRFDEQWMGTAQTDQLAMLAVSVLPLEDGAYVEIGTWQGWSAIPIARAITPHHLHVVDHWQGDGAAIPPELVARDNYGIFMNNVHEAGVNVTVHKMGWRQWIEEWGRKPIRFLHLDAAHTTVEVRDNILAVLPLMVRGGILCGDDWDWPTVEEGIWLALSEQNILPAETNPAVMFKKLWWFGT